MFGKALGKTTKPGLDHLRKVTGKRVDWHCKFVASLIVGSTTGTAASAASKDCKVPALWFMVKKKNSERDSVNRLERFINNIAWTFTPPYK